MVLYDGRRGSGNDGVSHGAGSAQPSEPSSASSPTSSSSPESLQQQAQQELRDEATEVAAKLAYPLSEQGSGLSDLAMQLDQDSGPVEQSAVEKWLNPDKSELPGDFNMPIWVCFTISAIWQRRAATDIPTRICKNIRNQPDIFGLLGFAQVEGPLAFKLLQ